MTRATKSGGGVELRLGFDTLFFKRGGMKIVKGIPQEGVELNFLYPHKQEIFIYKRC